MEKKYAGITAKMTPEENVYTFQVNTKFCVMQNDGSLRLRLIFEKDNGESLWGLRLGLTVLIKKLYNSYF